MKYPEKVERRPDRIAAVRYPEKVGCRPDRIAAVRHPDKVERWPDPDVRYIRRRWNVGRIELRL